MGLFSRSKPKIKVQTAKKDGFSGWLKCTHCNEMIHADELQRNANCCPKCDYHYRLSADERIKSLTEPNSFQELFSNFESVDALQFVDTESYTERLKNAKEKSGHEEAVLVGRCMIHQQPVAIGVLDFNFMGGSMGSVVGEKAHPDHRICLRRKNPPDHRLHLGRSPDARIGFISHANG